MAPPKPENENAAPAGPRNGVELDRKQHFRRANYQIGGETQAPAFEDLFGIDDAASAIEARRVDLVRNGYRPIPVDGKRPHLSGWQDSRADELDARRWTCTHSRAGNTGIVLGENLVAIDLDITDADVSAPLLDAADALGDGSPLVRVGQAPKALLLFRTDRPLSKRTTGKYRRAEGEKEQGVEILAAGQQFVADGIHPDTGQPYRWIGQSPLDVPATRLPLINHDRLDAFMQMADEHLGRTGWTRIRPASGVRKPDLFDDLLGEQASHDRLSPEKCREILSDLPANWCEDRDLWIRVGMALHDETAGSPEGFKLWDDWSRQSVKYDQHAIRRDWRSFRDKQSPVTIATLIEAGAAKRAERHNADIDAMFDEVPADVTPKPEKKAGSSKLQFLTPGQCTDAPSRGYIWKGMLAPGDVGCIFGAPGAGKSLITPYVGYMIARGQAAFGMRTKQGGVFYVAAEDPHGMRGRVSALKLTHGDADDFLLVEGVSNLLAKEAPDLAALVAAVKERKPALIVIDTLAMSFPGLEENSAEAMGRVVAVARALAKYGAAVLLIHHDTKAEGSTPRGHSLLNGALDMAIHVSRDENGVVRGKLTKNRNGSCDRDIAFRIATQEMGVDEDGDPITYAHAEELAPGAALKVAKLTSSEAAALEVLRDLAGIVPDMSQGVPEDDWRKACAETPAVNGSDNPESRRKAIYRAISGLVRKRRVTVRGGKAWAEDVNPAADDPFGEVEDDMLAA